MHISSQELPVVRRWAQKLYLVVASLILLGIVSEGALIGPSLFAATHWGREVHGGLGVVLFLLMLLLPVVSGLSRLPGRMTLLSGALAGLALIEVMSAVLGRKVALLAALHPATALLLVTLTVLLLMQAWNLTRQRRDKMKPEGGPPA